MKPPARPGQPACPAPGVDWNPRDYAANSAAQLAWARERIARLRLRGDERILDVGCGDGRISAELAAAVPRGHVTGLDSSVEMIAHARDSHPPRRQANLDFVLMDARAIHLPTRFDIVFSNAALHWVDDHRAFLRGAAGALRPGGRLWLSCGGQGNAGDVFTAVRAVMRRAPWRDCFRRLARPYFFYAPDEYREWLADAGFQAEGIRLADKDTTHAGAAGLAGWFGATWLPYTQRVPAARRETFIAEVVARYVAGHPPDAAGQVHVRMVRLEIEARRVDNPAPTS